MLTMTKLNSAIEWLRRLTPYIFILIYHVDT